MPEQSRFKTYLTEDCINETPVKLDLYIEPWEVVGCILAVGVDTFTFGDFGDEKSFLISDIRHYRLA